MEAGSACLVVLLYSTQSWQAPGDRVVRESVMKQPFPALMRRRLTMDVIQYAGCRDSNGCLAGSGSFIFRCLCHVIIIQTTGDDNYLGESSILSICRFLENQNSTSSNNVLL
jgi:hypothetical protein